MQLRQFSSGFLADKWGPKKTMNIAIWVFTLVTFITGYVRTFWQFIFLRLGLALGEGHHYVPAVRSIANFFPSAERGRANAALATTWAVAPAIVPLMVTWMMADWFDGAWRPVFFVLAVPGLVGIFLLWKYIQDSPRESLEKGMMNQDEHDMIVASIGHDAAVTGKKYSAKIFTTDVQFYLYSISWFIMLMIYWGMTTWISTFLVRMHGLNLKTMGFYASMPFVVAFFAMYSGGWIADKVFQGRPKMVTIIGFLGCIPVLYMIGATPKGDTGPLLFWLADGRLVHQPALGRHAGLPGHALPQGGRGPRHGSHQRRGSVRGLHLPHDRGLSRRHAAGRLLRLRQRVHLLVDPRGHRGVLRVLPEGEDRGRTRGL